jgi:GWxTD domain-containing protein
MMHLESWLQTPLAAAIGWTLFHSLWEGATIAALLAAILATTRSARARYAAASLAMCALLVSFGVTLFHLTPSWHALSPARNSIVLPWNNRAAPADIPEAPLRRVADLLPGLLPRLAPFWMAGVILFYLRHLAGWAMTRRMRRTGVCRAPDFWQERLNALARRLRLARPVVLLESCLAGIPVVIGHARPVILMPVGLLAGLPAWQVESILLHELAHIRRCDYLVNLLETSVENLLFYHPVVWWISGVIRAEREHCCDDVAVALSGGAHLYAVALAALEQRRGGEMEIALAATGGDLVKRIRRLLIPMKAPSSALTPFVCSGILLIAAAVGLMAWQAPQDQPAPKVSPFTKWLEEDVAYIILPEERATFLGLATDAERVQFIEQFWKRRDPTPDTPANEFKQEHYRRIAQANLRFPTAEGEAGWKTDRGRIYIKFGPPDEIDDHSNVEAPAVPYIDWTYRFIDSAEIKATNVKVEFVDPTRTHEFRMTSDPHPPAQ